MMLSVLFRILVYADAVSSNNAPLSNSSSPDGVDGSLFRELDVFAATSATVSVPATVPADGADARCCRSDHSSRKNWTISATLQSVETYHIIVPISHCPFKVVGTSKDFA
jgi:hypothetical protein